MDAAVVGLGQKLKSFPRPVHHDVLDLRAPPPSGRAGFVEILVDHPPRAPLALELVAETRVLARHLSEPRRENPLGVGLVESLAELPGLGRGGTGEAALSVGFGS